MKNRILCGFVTVLLIAVFTTSPFSAIAQQGGTTTYLYDANGRLYAVISPAGEAAVYDYDAAGNITAIRRIAANVLTILSFSPQEGMPGDLVTFLGVGFSGVTDVSFNGASAAIVSVTASKIVATVPAAATTGLVTITTPIGSATTATPFTLAGLRVTPSSAAVRFGETVQYMAEVLPATLDQAVQWSVDGIVGGNATVGTISTSGLFTAGNTRFAALTIRATSVADNTRIGEAVVRVSDPNDVQSILAPSVSVRRKGEIAGVAALTQQVAVQYGVLSVSQSALSQALSIQYRNLRGDVSALALGVSVQRGGGTQSAALANQISILYGNSLGEYAATADVSATKGPHIQSISPGNITRGTSVTLTVDGIGFSGATAIRFINATGTTNDTTITVSNIVVNGDGTSLTATVTVSGSSALGNRVVFISTPNGDTVTIDLGINRINVQ